MDFSKYKKVKQDNNSTTMQSDGGHTITLIHKTMPRLQVEQLKRLKMGDGGRVGLHIPEAKKMADGGKVKMMSDGGPDSTSTDDDTSSDTAAPDKSITINVGTPPAAGSADSAPQASAPGAAPTPPPATAPQDAISQVGNTPNNAPIPDMAPYAPNVDPKTGQQNPGAINANAQAVPLNQGKIAAASGQDEMQQNLSYMKAQQEFIQQQQQAGADIAKHTNDFAQHIQAVDPNHYIDNMSGGKKVATSLALFLGGFKQGYKGGNNPASDWLNSQIDRDIDAQKNAQDVNKTIYGAYRQLYGDTMATVNATKISMADLYTHMGRQIALKYNIPTAMANAQGLANAAAIATPGLLKAGAVDLTSLPGSHRLPGPQGASPQAGGHPGPGGSQGNAPGAGKAPQDQNPNSILSPDAMAKYKGATWGDPRMAADFAPGGEGARQFSQAAQVDRAIQDLPEIYKQLNNDAQEGGLKGYLQRRGESALGAVPYVGSALSGVSDIVTESPENRQFQAHQERLKSALLGSLSGTAAGSGDVNHFVNSLVPEFGDTYEVKQAKQASALDALKKHQKFDILDKWGLTRKSDKPKK